MACAVGHMLAPAKGRADFFNGYAHQWIAVALSWKVRHPLKCRVPAPLLNKYRDLAAAIYGALGPPSKCPGVFDFPIRDGARPARDESADAVREVRHLRRGPAAGVAVQEGRGKCVPSTD
jgi:hypothetical protein